jgi:hypothetical protein
MDDDRKAVLERVARGEISPAEGASLLEEIEARTASSSPPPPTDGPTDWAADWSQQNDWAPPPPSPGVGADRAAKIRVVRAIGTAEIVGDPTVSEAVAEGPHAARREGDTLVIEGQGDFEVAGFRFGDFGEFGPFGRRGGPRLGHRPGPYPNWRRRSGFPFGDLLPLRVRVNPDLPLEVEAQAGKLTIRGVHAEIKVEVQAGSTEIVDFRAPLDLTVQAGSVRARGRLDHGASRVRCEAGGVRIRLERGSSVRVSARATLGKVQFDSDEGRDPWVVGGGEGTLDITATMGSVRVTAD